MNISLNSNSTSFLNLRARRQTFGLGSFIFLLIFGGIFIAAGTAILRSSRIDPSWTKISGTIINSAIYRDSKSTTYSPIVGYTVDGRSYSVKSQASSSNIPVIGSPKEVAYNPAQPSQAKVVESRTIQLFLYSFPVVGALVIIGACLAFIRSRRRSHTIDSLTNMGQKLQGILTDVQTDTANNGSTYRIVVTATDAYGQVKDYVSDPLIGIGSLAMADFRNTPIPIDVYISQTDPSQYYVDISDIPSLTPQRIAELLASATKPQSAAIQTNPTAQPAPMQTPNQQPPLE